MTPIPPIPEEIDPMEMMAEMQPEIPEIPENQAIDLTDPESQDPNQSDIDQLAGNVKSLIDMIEHREVEVRRFKTAVWRRNELMYRGIQRLFWDEGSTSYRSASSLTSQEMESLNMENEKLDGIINIVKAHVDSIVGALSSAIPTTRFFPRDADDPSDLMTARAFTKVADFVEKTNLAPMLLIEALHILSTEDFVAGFVHWKKSEKYGTYPVEKYRTEMSTETYHICPGCGSMMDPIDPMSQDPMNPGQYCETCGENVQPEPIEQQQEVVVLDRVDEEHKGRVIIELYGPRHVTVPLGCRRLPDTPFLSLEQEVHLSVLRSLYPKLDLKTVAGDIYENNAWARIPVEYESQPTFYVTVKHTWLRECAYHMLMDKDKEAELKRLYPKGLCAVIIENQVAEIYGDEIEDHWVLSRNPMSRFIHSDPVANTIIPVQEMYTDLNDLTMDTIRHGIPETFADTNAVDFNVYKNHQSMPGTLLPAKAKPGMGLDSSFFTMKTASLSREVEFYMRELKEAAQFVSGAFPSVYGGPGAGGGTASEYEMSRNQALQRLSILWKMVNAWWPQVMTIATKMFKENLQYDENFVKKDGDGFVNVWLRRSEMEGNIADIEPELSEQFPASWAQKKAAIQELISSQNQALLGTVFHPTNMEFVYQTLGLEDLKIPGKADRDKQLTEISMLVKSGPNPDGSPTIPVDTELDDHDIHGQTIRDWLISDTGIDARVNNPEGWNNVYIHMQAHAMIKQQQMMQQQMAAEAQAAAGQKTKGNGKAPSASPQVNAPEEMPGGQNAG